MHICPPPRPHPRNDSLTHQRNMHDLPACRPDDGKLSALIELALILIYVCILIIRTCQYSADICKTFGFGSDANGAREELNAGRKRWPCCVADQVGASCTLVFLQAFTFSSFFLGLECCCSRSSSHP